MSFTVVVIARSLTVVNRFSISSGLVPLYCHTTVTTGMSMIGKISVLIVSMLTIPRTRISTAMTTKVYGRRSASRTIHIAEGPSWVMMPDYLYDDCLMVIVSRRRRTPHALCG